MSHTQLQRQHWSASQHWSMNGYLKCMHLTRNVSRHGIFSEKRLLLRLLLCPRMFQGFVCDADLEEIWTGRG